MKKLKKFLLFLIIFVIYGCTKYNAIEGGWLIEKIECNDKDMTNMLYYNMIAFEKNRIILPDLINHKNDDKAFWKLDKEKEIITIITENEIFSGEYQIVDFHNNGDNHILKLNSSKCSMILLKRDFHISR